MNKFQPIRTPQKMLYKEGQESLHLHTLHTQMGVMSFYDSISRCNKCAFCSRVCPAQLLEKAELYSPRARNILLRFIMDGKIGLGQDFRPVTRSCMLCGLCTKECFAKVPTHEHILELERSKGKRRMSFKCRVLGALQSIKISALKRKIKQTPRAPQVFFLPSFEAKFVDVKAGLHLYNILSKRAGSCAPLYGESGIKEYVYGTLPAARKKAAALIKTYFDACAQGDKKIVTDSLELYNFIQKYPQLFSGDGEKEAKVFAANTVFLTDYLGAAVPARKEPAQVLLSKTSLFCAEEPLFDSAQKLAQKVYGKNFVSGWDGQFYPLPLLGYTSVNKRNSALFLKQKAAYAAHARADIILCMSLEQKILLNKTLKNYYPKCKAVYIGELYG